MKKYFVALLILLFAVSGNAATMVSGRPCAGGAAALSCTGATLQQSEESTTNDSNIGAAATATWKASEIAYSGTTGTLCKVSVALRKVGTPTGNATMYIYSSTSHNPNASLGSCGTLDISTLTTDYAWKDFTCNIASFTNGTDYHIVINSPYIDGSSYIQWATEASCAVENIDYADDGADWKTTSVVYCTTFKLYILE